MTELDAAQAAVEMCNVSEAFDVPDYEDLDDESEQEINDLLGAKAQAEADTLNKS